MPGIHLGVKFDSVACYQQTLRLGHYGLNNVAFRVCGIIVVSVILVGSAMVKAPHDYNVQWGFLYSLQRQ